MFHFIMQFNIFIQFITWIFRESLLYYTQPIGDCKFLKLLKEFFVLIALNTFLLINKLNITTYNYN